jgi:hypothetical protein
MAMICARGAVTVDLVPASADRVRDSLMEQVAPVNRVYYTSSGDLRLYRKLNMQRRYLRKMTEPLSGPSW